jgi:hypothetical protein
MTLKVLACMAIVMVMLDVQWLGGVVVVLALAVLFIDLGRRNNAK